MKACSALKSVSRRRSPCRRILHARHSHGSRRNQGPLREIAAGARQGGTAGTRLRREAGVVPWDHRSRARRRLRLFERRAAPAPARDEGAISRTARGHCGAPARGRARSVRGGGLGFPRSRGDREICAAQEGRCDRGGVPPGPPPHALAAAPHGLGTAAHEPGSGAARSQWRELGRYQRARCHRPDAHFCEACEARLPHPVGRGRIQQRLEGHAARDAFLYSRSCGRRAHDRRERTDRRADCGRLEGAREAGLRAGDRSLSIPPHTPASGSGNAGRDHSASRTRAALRARGDGRDRALGAQAGFHRQFRGTGAQRPALRRAGREAASLQDEGFAPPSRMHFVGFPSAGMAL